MDKNGDLNCLFSPKKPLLAIQILFLISAALSLLTFIREPNYVKLSTASKLKFLIWKYLCWFLFYDAYNFENMQHLFFYKIHIIFMWIYSSYEILYTLTQRLKFVTQFCTKCARIYRRRQTNCVTFMFRVLRVKHGTRYLPICTRNSPSL